MVQITTVITFDNKPINLPDPENIIQQVRIANSKSRGVLSGVPLVDESSNVAPYAWVKFGNTTTMGEALTQQFVSQVLSSDADAAVHVPCVYLAFQSGRCGFIVMEYIDGSKCCNSDAALIITAVESLIAIRGPTLVPGPIGGGPIRHYMFTDVESPITYDSVQELEDHINGILRYTERKERARFGPEVEKYGLRLCPCDMKLSRFMKDKTGTIVALNFSASCFLPPSFFDVAQYVGSVFSRSIAGLVKNPESGQLEAVLGANYATIPFDTDKIGIPRYLRHKLKK